MTDIENKNTIVRANPNKELYQEITQVIRDNDGYCCCALEKNQDTLCMCKAFQEQEESGFCHCGRFFKVKEYPIITICCAPFDENEANSIAQSFSAQGFVVLTPMFGNELAYTKYKQVYDDLQKDKIYKADLVFVMNSSQKAIDFLEEQIYWMEELQKKIVYQYITEAKNNENREFESI